jgi:hypothetical protein
LQAALGIAIEYRSGGDSRSALPEFLDELRLNGVRWATALLTLKLPATALRLHQRAGGADRVRVVAITDRFAQDNRRSTSIGSTLRSLSAVPRPSFRAAITFRSRLARHGPTIAHSREDVNLLCCADVRNGRL